MRVMSTGVMHAGVLRLVRRVDVCRDRKRVHIRAPCDHAAWPGSLEQGDDAMLADAGLHFIQSESAELCRDHLSGALLAVRKLGMLMEIAPLRDDGVAQRVGRGRDPLRADLTETRGGD